MVSFETLWNGNYWEVALLAAMVMLPLIAIVYMIGRAIGRDALTSWAKDEFYQFFGSLFIIATVILLLALVNMFILDILITSGFSCTQNGCNIAYQTISYGAVVEQTKTCGGAKEDACHIALAKVSLDTMYDLVRNYAADQMATSGFLTILSNVKASFGPQQAFFKRYAPGIQVTFQPLAFFEMITNIYDTLLDFLYMMVFLIKANSMMLEVVNVALFPYFLIMGVALRALSTTRKLGGLLIAIALVLYFIYPLVITLSSALIAPSSKLFVVDFGYVYGREISLVDIQDQFDVATSGGSVDFVTFNIFRPIMPYQVRSGEVVNGELLSGEVVPGGIADTVAFMSVWVFFQFIVVLYATIISIRELSPFFGGDVEIAGLTRLI
jgi:hypothetical protein